MKLATAWRVRLAGLIAPYLIEKVPREHRQPDSEFLRRRIVVAITFVAGTALLGVLLSVRPGSSAFYPVSIAVAAIWLVGGLASGPLHLGYALSGTKRPVLAPIVIGLIAGAVFLLGALVVREIGPLRDYVNTVLAHARKGSLTLIAMVTLINGFTEEVFFRGALFAAIGERYPVLISVAVYAIATTATGNPMLVFAATTLGFVLALQRRASGGILAPILTHLSWSVVMVFALPHVI